jgi:hypothetical protein
LLAIVISYGSSSTIFSDGGSGMRADALPAARSETSIEH